MKTCPLFLLLFCLLFSCTKNEITPIEELPEKIIDEEPVDESTLQFQDGFTGRKLNTNIKAVIPSDKSILMSTATTEEEALVKFSIPDQSNQWQAETWYREKAGTGNFHYRYDDLILFRQGHHDFAISLEDGTLQYDEVREGCPDSRIAGLKNHYFTRSTIIDESTQHTKDVILIGDIRQAKMPEMLLSPLYDSIGDDGSLGRIMNVEAFENEIGEELLAIRYFDYQLDSPRIKDLFAVYNITQSNWVVEHVPLEHHDTGTQIVIANGLIYFGSQSFISCLDTQTGELKWFSPGLAILPNLLAFADGAIFMRDQSGMLQRRDAETGDLIWETYLGNLQRFIIIHDKLFSIDRDLIITNIETGTTIHSFSSPYLDYTPSSSYFGKTSHLMGYYDEATQRSHVFLNVDDHMICYEIAD